MRVNKMPPRPKKRNQSEQTSGLLNALKFLSLITKDTGSPMETHVILANKQAVASNGILSAGHKIEEDLTACPNNRLLIEALSRCKSEYSITQLDNNRIAISSGKFKANLPCLDVAQLAWAIPDEPIAVINDELKKAIEATSVLANESGEFVYNRSVLLNGPSVIGTNGKVMLEYWHGIDLPTNLAIPKSFANLLKTEKTLSRFGFSSGSVTLWFEDGNWIKTQLFADQWPNINQILNVETKPIDVPAELFVGLDAVAPFAPESLVRFADGCIKSNDEQASYEVAGLPPGPVFNAKQLALLKGWMEKADWFVDGPHGPMHYFFGGKMRGVIAGRRN
jgi:hypothetical protein